MRRWQSHRIVEAEPITALEEHPISGRDCVITGTGTDAYRHEVPEDFFARGKAIVGDYFVQHENGHLAWSPKAVFEADYTLVDLMDDNIAVSYRGQGFAITREEIEDNLMVAMFMERAAKLLGHAVVKDSAPYRESIAQGATFGGGQMPLLVDHNGRAVAVVPEVMEKLEEIRAIILRDRYEPRAMPDTKDITVSNCNGAFVITGEEFEDGLAMALFQKRLWRLMDKHPDDVIADSVEPLATIADLEAGNVEVMPDGSIRRKPTARATLVRFLVARIAKFEAGYDSTDAARMEELSWLLLQAVGGNIL